MNPSAAYCFHMSCSSARYIFFFSMSAICTYDGGAIVIDAAKGSKLFVDVPGGCGNARNVVDDLFEFPLDRYTMLLALPVGMLSDGVICCFCLYIPSRVNVSNAPVVAMFLPSHCRWLVVEV